MNFYKLHIVDVSDIIWQRCSLFRINYFNKVASIFKIRSASKYRISKLAEAQRIYAHAMRACSGYGTRLH